MRILIADDHPLVLSGIEAVLRASHHEVVAVLTNGTDVLPSVAATDPDLLLLDVRMPGASGVDVLRMLRNRGDRRPVVLLTAHVGDKDLVDALQLGVDGLVLKDGANDVLIECLDQVAAGQRWIDRDLLSRGLELTLKGLEPEPVELKPLTPRERSIAKLTAKGYRNKEVAAELGLTEGTVKVWLHRIYEKLGVSNRTELANLVREEESRTSARN